MPEVNCTISNCHYWEQANLCGANSILITAGPAEGADPHRDHAVTLERTPVRLAGDSFCHTFRIRQEAYVEDEDEVETAVPAMPLI